MSAGYSGKLPYQKLGLKRDQRVLIVNSPGDYRQLTGAPPPSELPLVCAEDSLDFIHFFVRERHELEANLAQLLTLIQPNGMIWVSWPKKASRVPTDVTEDIIRDIALSLGLVDVKVCAVDQIWSGLKLVKRLRDR